MSDSDIMSFLTYQNAGGMNTDFTSVKSALKWDPIYYSRTANASYGIGLAAVILNDEAMGYNSKIIFITDSSVSVDSRFLKLAIKLDIENPIIRINTAFKGCSSLEKISVLPRIYHN